MKAERDAVYKSERMGCHKVAGERMEVRGKIIFPLFVALRHLPF